MLLPGNSTVNIEQAGESDMFRLVMFSSGPVDLDSLDQRGMLVQNSCVNDSVTAPKDQRRANPIPLQQKLSRTHLLCTALFGIYGHKIRTCTPLRFAEPNRISRWHCPRRLPFLYSELRQYSQTSGMTLVSDAANLLARASLPVIDGSSDWPPTESRHSDAVSLPPAA